MTHETSRAPYQFMDNLSVFSGIASDYVRRGTTPWAPTCKPCPVCPGEAIEKFLSGDLDVRSCVVVMEKRGQKMLYSISYLTSSVVIFTRKQPPRPDSGACR